MSQVTFFSVARRPKWIAGLLFSLAVAAVFALLGQWQLERTFTVVEPAVENEKVFVLNDIATPGAPITAEAANVLVSANIMLDQSNVFIVSDRLQQAGDEIVSGYWLIANSGALLADNDNTGSLTVAIGFSENLETIEQARTELQASMLPQAFLESTGRYLQTEAPVDVLACSIVSRFSENPIATVSEPVLSLSVSSAPEFAINQYPETISSPAC